MRWTTDVGWTTIVGQSAYLDHSPGCRLGNRRVHVIEWRYGGHRLAYVSAIADAASVLGHDVWLHTTETVVESDEYRTHLAERSTTLVATYPADQFVPRSLHGLLRRCWRQGDLVVLPEADRLLPLLAVGAVVRALPRPMAVVAMRPPRWRRPRHWPASVAKALSLLVLSTRLTAVDLLLLEDPVATGRARVWGFPFARERHRLNDPADLIPIALGSLPNELADLEPERPMLSVIGSIDARKRVPLVLDSWMSRSSCSNSILVVAGPQRPDVRSALASQDLSGRPDIRIVDRYLTNGEIDAVIRRSSAVVALQSDDLASGTTVAAAARGRWVITDDRSRNGRSAASFGYGIPVRLNAPDLAKAFDHALSRADLPSLRPIPTRSDFGRRVIQTLTQHPDGQMASERSSGGPA